MIRPMVGLVSSRSLAAGGFVMCTLVACGAEQEGAPSPESFTSGTRLRTHSFEADGGARVVVGFFDSEIGEACTFQHTGGDRYHCLPTNAGRAVFSDAQCTQPAVAVDPYGGCGQPPQRYALSYSSASGWCGYGSEGEGASAVFEVGAAIAGNTTYQLLADGSCRASDSTGALLYALSPVDLAVFVEASEERVEVGGQLGARVRLGRDGSRQVFGLFDTGTGLACEPFQPYPSFIPAAPGLPTPCAPTPFIDAPNYYYKDAACTQSVAYQSRGCPAAAAVLQSKASPDGCSFSSELHAIGAPVDPSVVRVGEACTPFEGTDVVFFEVGELTTARFPSVVPQPLGRGRLVTYAAAAPAGKSLGLPQPGGVFFDQELGSWCKPWLGSDGNIYCVSAQVVARKGASLYYSDAACSVEIVDVGDCDDAPPRYGTRTTLSGSSCIFEAVEDSFEIGPAVSVSEVYTKSTSGCLGPSTPAAGQRFHEGGASGGLGVFAQLSEVTE